jgi:dihydroorotate dehydrogenase
MGWYEAVGRRLFFSLDPERSHRLAHRLLGLPLPWRTIGGAVDDPALRTSLAGITLRNPIGLAAGFDKTCAHLDALGSLGFGFVVGGTVTRAPRRGNPHPRIARDPARRALVNAMGMPNPGAEAVARILARTARTAPRLVSIADEAVADTVATAELVGSFVDGIELNASSPNAGWEHASPHTGELVRALRERTSKPLFVKIPPFPAGGDERTQVVSIATAARDAGASGIVCANTLPVADPRMSTGRGGLSGAPLTADTPRMVAEIVDAIGPDVPVVASGGIFTADDARRCLDAGAVAIQVYTALVYVGPGLPGSLTRGLAATVRTMD